MFVGARHLPAVHLGVGRRRVWLSVAAEHPPMPFGVDPRSATRVVGGLHACRWWKQAGRCSARTVRFRRHRIIDAVLPSTEFQCKAAAGSTGQRRTAHGATGRTPQERRSTILLRWSIVCNISSYDGCRAQGTVITPTVKKPSVDTRG